VNKSAIRDAILEHLRATLALQAGAAQLARDEAISEESRPENKWDTHSQEAAYLAEGQARQAAELAAALAAWRALVFPPASHAAAQVGSLVTLVAGARTDHILLGPTHGGLTLAAPDDGREITVVTPGSPLGRALLGRPVGATLPPPRQGAPVPRIAALA